MVRWPSEKPLVRVICAGLIGNVMEWYDFSLYGYFAVTIGREFFPDAQPGVSLLAAFATFAAGFLVRPLGGVVLGRIGDRMGSQHALLISVVAMAIPTTLMAALPTYDQVGILAPILLVILRLMQGHSAGGEYTTSIIYLCERAPSRKRGWMAMWGLWGSVAGMLLASALGDCLARGLSPEQLHAWGWRIAFALGSVIALVGVLLRNHLRPMQSAEPPSRQPLRELVMHRSALLRVLLLNVASSVSFYLLFVYVVSDLESIDKLSSATALNLNTKVMGLLLILYPISALIGDRVGRKPMFILGSGWLVLGAWPVLHLLQSHDPSTIWRGELGLVMAVAILAGAKNAANVELMPQAIRNTGLALAFNLAEGWIGGLTPLAATWLVMHSGHPTSPALLLVGAGVVTLVTAVGFTRETAFAPLQGSTTGEGAPVSAKT